MTEKTPLGPAWHSLLDDATLVAPDRAVTPGDVETHGRWRADHPDLAGALVVRDTDLPLLRGVTHPLRVVLSTGAGGLAGPLALAARLGLDIRAVQVALRDVDDLAGNARRVVAALDAARADGVADDDLCVHVEIPTDLPGGVSGGWGRAADEVAAAELALHFRTSSPHAGAARPAEVAAWIDAALDRETAYSCTARATLSSDGEVGVANLLLATRRAFDGSDAAEVGAILAGDDPESVLEQLRTEEYLPGARRWLHSVQVAEPGGLDWLRWPS